MTPLPPGRRGPLAAAWASAAARRALELPVCEDCGSVQYPLRDRCRHCLSPRVAFHAVPAGGSVLASTLLHRSGHAAFGSCLPLRIASVALDAGPTVIAFAPLAPLDPGRRVTLCCGVDRSGQATLIAMPETRTEPADDADVAGDPTREVRGKVVLITGASGGIGRALVEQFLAAGAAQVLAGSRAPDAATDPRVQPLVLDVSDGDSVAAAAAQHARRVDILVNNSGINSGRRVFQLTAQEALRELDVNCLGLLRMCQAFMPTMLQRGSGVVVNMLSVLAHVNLPLMASYSASKAAAMSFTQAFRAEASGSGVRVCGVYPSLVDTAMSARAPGPKLLPQELAAQLIDAIRVGFEDLYPGAAEPLRAAVQRDWKAAERQMAQRLAAATGRPV